MGVFLAPVSFDVYELYKKKSYIYLILKLYIKMKCFSGKVFFQIKCVWLDDKHGSFLVRT